MNTFVRVRAAEPSQRRSNRARLRPALVFAGIGAGLLLFLAPAARAQTGLPPAPTGLLPTILPTGTPSPAVPATPDLVPPQIRHLVDDATSQTDGIVVVPDEQADPGPGTHGGPGGTDSTGVQPGSGGSNHGSDEGSSGQGSGGAGSPTGVIKGSTNESDSATSSGRSGAAGRASSRTIAGSLGTLAANVGRLAKPMSIPLGLAVVAIVIGFLATRRPGQMKFNTEGTWGHGRDRWRL